MTVNYTSLLSLGQPVTGTESGTWGDDVNNAVTAYLDIAIAGTLSFTGDGAVTLSNTQGTNSATNIGSTTAQYHALKIVGPLTAIKVITAPSSSRSYVVINTDSTYGVTIKASGQTGVTIPANSRGFVAFDGTDYAFVSGSNITNLTGVLPIANGGTNASTAANARTNLGATTVGNNFFTLANPSAVTFPRMNADNSVSSLNASDFRTAIGAGTGNGTVTSVGGTGTVNGISLSGTVTSTGNLTLGGTLSGVNLGSQVTGTLPVANGGTGLTATPTNGQIDIGNGSGFTRTTLTAGSNISITNGAGSITIAATGIGTGTVTSVGGTGSVNGITLSGTVTSSGNLTLGGSLSGVSLTSQVAGTLPVGNGGTGATTFTSGYLLKGNGASAVSSSAIYDDGTNVGIGNTNPGSFDAFGRPLVVGNGSTNQGITIYSSISNNGAIQFADGTSGADAYRGVVEYLHGADSMKFYTNGTEKVVINSSGNVTIGQSPSLWATITALQVKNTFMGGLSGNAYFGVNAYYDGANYKYISTNYALLYTQQSSGDHVWYNAPSGTAGNTVTFTERMRMDISGNVGIGTTVLPGKLNVLGGADQVFVVRERSGALALDGVNLANNAFKQVSICGTGINFQINAGDKAKFDSNGYLLIDYATSNGAYKLQVNSQIFATDATIATSDGRYKENVATIPSALGIVSSLRPVSFSWKPHPIHNFSAGATDIGFIAQEVQQALEGTQYAKQVVKENAVTLPDGTQESFLGIADSKLIPLLVKAIQELEAKVATLESKLN